MFYYLSKTAADINYFFPSAEINKYLWLIRSSLSLLQVFTWLNGCVKRQCNKAEQSKASGRTSWKWVANHRRKSENPQTSQQHQPPSAQLLRASSTPPAHVTVLWGRAIKTPLVLATKALRTSFPGLVARRSRTDFGIWRPETCIDCA